MCEHQPAKRFPYREITGFCVNKYTDSGISEMRRPVGDRKTDSFQPSAQEKDITLLDFIGISERLGGAASVSDDACWEVKRRE